MAAKRKAPPDRSVAAPPQDAARSAEAWKLAALGQDAELVTMAIAAAGSAKRLSDLSGIRPETIPRGKNSRRRHGLAQTTRTWLATYAADPAHPPTPLEALIGQRPRAGVQAPQVVVSTQARRLFKKRALVFGQRAVFEWCMRTFLAAHPQDLPDIDPLPEQRSTVRCYRVDADLLEEFEARCGGPEQRARYLRVAIETGMPRLAKATAATGLPPIEAPREESAPPPRRRDTT